MSAPRSVTVTQDASGIYVLRFSEAPDSVTGNLVGFWLLLRGRAELAALGNLIGAHLAGETMNSGALAAVRKTFDDEVARK